MRSWCRSRFARTVTASLLPAVGRPRLAEQVALHFVAAFAFHEPELRLGLHAFCRDGEAEAARHLDDSGNDGVYLGTEQWLETMRTWVEGEERSREIPKTQRFIARPGADRVLEVVAEVMEVSVADIVEDRGGLPRMLAAFLAVREGCLRLRDVATSLTLTSAGHISDLVRRCARAIDQQRDVAARAEACLARLRPAALALG